MKKVKKGTKEGWQRVVQMWKARCEAHEKVIAGMDVELNGAMHDLDTAKARIHTMVLNYEANLQALQRENARLHREIRNLQRPVPQVNFCSYAEDDIPF